MLYILLNPMKPLNMRRLKFVFIVAVISTIQSVAQLMYKDEPAFKSGELAVYNVYYNLGFIWIHAGDVKFSVTTKQEDGNSRYLLQLAGHTIKSFDSFYRIRDTFSVTVDKKDLVPYNYREVKYEDSYFADRRYRFDHEFSSKVFWKFNRKGDLSSDSMEIDKSVFDLLTTCYRFRSLDMKTVEKGTVIPFNMLYDKSVYNLGLRYKGKEEIKLRNKYKYKALKFVPKVITGDLFKNEDDLTIYVSDDDNHVPLYIEAKIKVGAVKVMLQNIDNTKYPMVSVLKKK